MKIIKSSMKNSPKSRMSNFLVIFLLFLMIIFGLSLMFTPYLENLDHRKLVTQEITTFKELVSVYKPAENIEKVKTPEQYPELWAAMQDYNKEIFENGQSDLVDAWSFESDVFNLFEYGFNSNAFGLVVIPDISVEMPLYLGASYNNLAKGFAQLSQTSMQIGGENTNCVIAGHRGWNGMPFMRDVELLDVGDSIYVKNPWETMEYRISEIFLIEPNNIESILIQDGRDLLSIITCHPYGVGSHRYVLICERCEGEVIEPEISGTWIWEWHDRVSITSNESVEFESSQLTIFVSVYLPWICLFLAVFIITITIAILIVRGVRLKMKKASK